MYLTTTDYIGEVKYWQVIDAPGEEISVPMFFERDTPPVRHTKSTQSASHLVPFLVSEVVLLEAIFALYVKLAPALQGFSLWRSTQLFSPEWRLSAM